MSKTEIARACARMKRLCVRHGIEPQAAVGLLSLQALASANLTGVRLWKCVADKLRPRRGAVRKQRMLEAA